MFVLIYYLMVERLSPATSAFNAILWLAAIMVIQHPIQALIRQRRGIEKKIILPERLMKSWAKFQSPVTYLIPVGFFLYGWGLARLSSLTAIILAIIAGGVVYGLQRVVSRQITGEGSEVVNLLRPAAKGPCPLEPQQL